MRKICEYCAIFLFLPFLNILWTWSNFLENATPKVGGLLTLVEKLRWWNLHFLFIEKNVRVSFIFGTQQSELFGKVGTQQSGLYGKVGTQQSELYGKVGTQQSELHGKVGTQQSGILQSLLLQFTLSPVWQPNFFNIFVLSKIFSKMLELEQSCKSDVRQLEKWKRRPGASNKGLSSPCWSVDQTC